MAIAPQEENGIIHIQKSSWSARNAHHLEGYLTSSELDHLWFEINSGNVQLWNVYRLNTIGNEHVATVCTRIEEMYDRTKHLVVIHGGGEFVESLPSIHDYLYEEAKNKGCKVFRAIVARKGVAEILRRQYGCRDYEYLVMKEVF